MKLIKEGKAIILVEPKEIVDKKMPVFYNPIMIINRDFSLLLLKALKKKDLVIADVLAGSGIRTLRILKELNIDEIKKIVVNDTKKGFCDTFNENLKKNNLQKYKDKLLIKNEDANKTLSTEGHFDYIEIDPFGTPNPFLDASIRALKRNGILSVTATDTSALCGSYPLACKRKYWSEPLRNELMHEFAVRILIRKVQLLGAQHEKALLPMVSYAKDHYIKIFFQSTNSKTKTDEVLKEHKYYKNKGPIWMGEIQNKEILEKMMQELNENISKKTVKLLELLIGEAQIKTPFYYDLHKISSEEKAKNIPRKEKIIKKLTEKGFKASKTHFNENAAKTNANKQEFISVFKECR